MKKYDKVILISFNGLLESPDPVYKNEDYWKLINSEGEIVSLAEDLNFHDTNRCLVKFKKPLSDFGLESHNEISNSLWILYSDLKIL